MNYTNTLPTKDGIQTATDTLSDVTMNIQFHETKFNYFKKVLPFQPTAYHGIPALLVKLKRTVSKTAK